MVLAEPGDQIGFTDTAVTYYDYLDHEIVLLTLLGMFHFFISNQF